MTDSEGQCRRGSLAGAVSVALICCQFKAPARPGSAPAAAAADPSRPPYVAACSQQPPANGNVAEHEFPAACSVFSSSFCQQVDSVLLQLVFPAVTGTCPPPVRVGACQFLGVLFFFLSVCISVTFIFYNSLLASKRMFLVASPACGAVANRAWFTSESSGGRKASHKCPGQADSVHDRNSTRTLQNKRSMGRATVFVCSVLKC